MTTPHRAPPGPKPDPMGPDPDPAPDPDPIPVPNPDPEPLPEEPAHAHAHGRSPRVTFRVTARPSRFGLRIAAAIVSVGGVIAACYNDVPGPQGPLPSPLREVPPQGPAPGPILPTPHLAPTLDAGIAVPQGASSAARLTIPAGARVALREGDPPPRPQHASDAGVVDSASDLPPEVPDAGPIATPDAGQPVK